MKHWQTIPLWFALALSPAMLWAKSKTLPIKDESTICSASSSCTWTAIARLKNAPFPYNGSDGDNPRDFYDSVDPASGIRIHTTSEGTRYPESGHYTDNRVLFHVPPGFDGEREFSYVVYFHGHFTELKEIAGRDRILEQVNGSGRNVILIAPQFARNAADSSAGKFYQPEGFKNFMAEAEDFLIENWPQGATKPKDFHGAPIILLGYSGGYKPIAYVLDRGGVAHRIAGLLLLDVLYAELDKFESWILAHQGDSFFVSLYTASSAKKTLQFLKSLRKDGIAVRQQIPSSIAAGEVYCYRSPAEHQNVPRQGPPADPVKAWLQAVTLPR